MSKSVIEVKPAPDLVWGVYVNEELTAISKASYECDLFAERLAKMCDNVIVDHHAADRPGLMAEMEAARKEKKKT